MRYTDPAEASKRLLTFLKETVPVPLFSGFGVKIELRTSSNRIVTIQAAAKMRKLMSNFNFPSLPQFFN